LDLISGGFITEFSKMQSKEVGKFRSKQFRGKKRLDLLTVNVLNGFYFIFYDMQFLRFWYFQSTYDFRTMMIYFRTMQI